MRFFVVVVVCMVTMARAKMHSWTPLLLQLRWADKRANDVLTERTARALHSIRYHGLSVCVICLAKKWMTRPSRPFQMQCNSFVSCAMMQHSRACRPHYYDDSSYGNNSNWYLFSPWLQQRIQCKNKKFDLCVCQWIFITLFRHAHTPMKSIAFVWSTELNCDQLSSMKTLHAMHFVWIASAFERWDHFYHFRTVFGH